MCCDVLCEAVNSRRGKDFFVKWRFENENRGPVMCASLALCMCLWMRRCVCVCVMNADLYDFQKSDDNIFVVYCTRFVIRMRHYIDTRNQYYAVAMSVGVILMNFYHVVEASSLLILISTVRGTFDCNERDMRCVSISTNFSPL